MNMYYIQVKHIPNKSKIVIKYYLSQTPRIQTKNKILNKLQRNKLRHISKQRTCIKNANVQMQTLQYNMKNDLLRTGEQYTYKLLYVDNKLNWTYY